MPESDRLKRYLEAGAQFTDMTRSRAREIVRDLVNAGEVQREQAQDFVEELVERSRRNTEAVADLVRREVQKQAAAMGLVTRDDLARLEARLTGGKAAPAAKAPVAKAPATKAPATKKPPVATKAAPVAKGPATKKAAKPA